MKAQLIYLIVVCTCIGCGGGPQSRVANSPKFWPEAPPPKHHAAFTLLAYKPDNVIGYDWENSFVTTYDDDNRITTRLAMALRFTPGKSSGERSVFVHRLVAEVKGPAERTWLALDKSGVVIDNSQGRQSFPRGERAPLDVELILGRSIFSVTFARNTVLLAAAENAALTSIDANRTDLIATLFPDLPMQPMQVGHKWRMTRSTTPLPATAPLSVTYDLEYLGDSVCMSIITKTCAQIGVVASSNKVDVLYGGRKGRLSLAFAGRVFFNIDDGVVDETKMKSAATVEFGDDVVDIDGVVSLKRASVM